MHLGRFRIAEKRVVATHVVIIDRLAQQRHRAFQQKVFRLQGFAELVQAKTSVQIAGGAMRRDSANSSTNRKSTRPFLLPHQMVKPELQNLGTLLGGLLDRVQLGEGFAVHAQFGIAGGRPQSPFTVHSSL